MTIPHSIQRTLPTLCSSYSVTLSEMRRLCTQLRGASYLIGTVGVALIL